jgi:prevent-host-death family protein
MQTLTNILQKKFIGTDDLRKNLTSVLDDLSRTGDEIVITQHGKPQAVIFNLEAYLELQEQLADADPELIKSVNDALDDVKKNGGIPAEEVFKELGI